LLFWRKRPGRLCQAHRTRPRKGSDKYSFDEDGNWHYFEYKMEVPLVSEKYATNGNLYTEMTHDYNRD
jgi:hypothetical protein